MTDRDAARRALVETVGKVIDYLQGQGATKAAPTGIDAIVQGYIDDLSRDALDVLDGKISMPAAARAHSASLDDLANRAYDTGMTDGGADPDERDDTDNAAVSDWTSEQDSHVQGLWDDVKQLRRDKPDLSNDEYDARFLSLSDRIGQWGASVRNLYSLAKANSQRNKSVTWRYEDTDHCSTCAGLNGKRHRLKWFLDKGYIPQENGSETLDCHGYHCQCHLDDDDDNQVMP